jgi:hypothetical protein
MRPEQEAPGRAQRQVSSAAGARRGDKKQAGRAPRAHRKARHCITARTCRGRGRGCRWRMEYASRNARPTKDRGEPARAASGRPGHREGNGEPGRPPAGARAATRRATARSFWRLHRDRRQAEHPMRSKSRGAARIERAGREHVPARSQRMRPQARSCRHSGPAACASRMAKARTKAPRPFRGGHGSPRAARVRVTTREPEDQAGRKRSAASAPGSRCPRAARSSRCSARSSA